MSPRAILLPGRTTRVAQVQATYDRHARQLFDDDIGAESYALFSATLTSLLVGYKFQEPGPANFHDFFYRIGMDFNLSVVPAASTVSAVNLLIIQTAADGAGGTIEWGKKGTAGAYSSESDPQTFFQACAPGTSYGTLASPSTGNQTFSFAFNAAGVTEVQSTIGTATILSIFLCESPASNPATEVNFLKRTMRSIENVDSLNTPSLQIFFTPPGGATKEAFIPNKRRSRAQIL